jgi:putative FmdB family regulatory protein
MPIFDFECSDCGATFEALVLGSTSAQCACGSSHLTKLISPIAPEARSASFLKNARKVAAREGHFSNYTASERPRGRS